MLRKHHSRIHAFLTVLLIGWHVPAFAQSVMALQVTPSASQSQPVELSLADLDAMAQVTFTTSTIWTDEDVTFSGVPLKVLLAEIGARGTAIEMVALNDYKVTLPVTALEDSAPSVATRMDGAPMSVRDKGPYWVVFPYDQDLKYQSETIYSFSIWQLNRLKVVD